MEITAKYILKENDVLFERFDKCYKISKNGSYKIQTSKSPDEQRALINAYSMGWIKCEEIYFRIYIQDVDNIPDFEVLPFLINLGFVVLDIEYSNFSDVFIITTVKSDIKTPKLLQRYKKIKK